MEEKEMGVGCMKKEYQKSKKADDQVKYKKRTFLNW
jgi:hypothetical protein